MIDSRLASNVEDVHNRSFSVPSPVPVRLSLSQGRQDPSMPCPRTVYGNPGGEPEEPVLAESAMSSFLGSVWAEGIAVPQAVSILDTGNIRLTTFPTYIHLYLQPHVLLWFLYYVLLTKDD